MTLGARPRLPAHRAGRGPARRTSRSRTTSRAVDRGWRPVYAVWEVTLKCDLACRHCGSRAGHARPDELSTARGPRPRPADGGARRARGHAHRRRGVPARRLARHRPRGPRARHAVHAPRRARAASPTRSRAPPRPRASRARACRSTGSGATHDHVRALDGSFDAAMRGLRSFRAAGIPVSANTHINRLNLREIPEVFERLVAEGIHAWQMQLTVAMGRAADEERLLLEPYQVLEVLPMLARIEAPRRRGQGAPLGRQQHRLLRPLRGRAPGVVSAAATWARAARAGRRSASRRTATSRAARRCRRRLRGRQRARPLARGHLGALGAAALHARARARTTSGVTAPTATTPSHCLGGCTWTTHVLFGKPGNNPFCHHRALELLREGKRERIVRVETRGRACPSTTASSRSSRRRGRRTSSNGRGILR